MTTATLLENFELLMEAPNAVVKMRELVLELAVRGRLVGQDENEESVEALFKRITIAKSQSRRKGSATLPASKETSSTLDLPDSWKAIRLGDICELISGQHLGKEEQNEDGKGLPYLTGPADFGLRHPIATRWTHEERAVAIKDDVLITVKGAGVGKANILGMDRAAVGRQLMAIRPYEVSYDYIYLVVRTAYYHFQASSIGSTVPGIGREDILQFELGLPPLPEQHRIVAKVDELMAMCDRLEANLAACNDTRHRLLDALLHEALKPVEHASAQGEQAAARATWPPG